MFSFFLIVLLVPLALAGLAYVLLDGVTLKEFGLIVLAALVVAGSSAGIVSCANTHDVEVWNGVTTGKERNTVSCSHSYSCNCHQVCSGSGKNRSCSEHCDTCYEHSHDYDWDVYTTVGTITIDRVDRQGVHEPGRFTSTKMGEPVSVTRSYDNYVKAAPGTLFRHQGLKEKYAGTVPEYPQAIYDYWHLDRLVTVGVNVDNPKAWNHELSRINSDLGKPKQVNMIVVLVKNKPDDWYYALEETWIGGKKNDAVLVVSVDDQMKPQWASVMAWTSNELFKVKLRDDIMDEQVINRDTLMTALATNVSKYYVRKPMKDFEYLSSSITPSTTQWVVTLLIALFVCGGLTVFFQVNDVFGDEGYGGGFRGRRMPTRDRFKDFKFPNPFRRRKPAWMLDE